MFLLLLLTLYPFSIMFTYQGGMLWTVKTATATGQQRPPPQVVPRTTTAQASLSLDCALLARVSVSLERTRKPSADVALRRPSDIIVTVAAAAAGVVVITTRATIR